jgi:hypothetical protein
MALALSGLIVSIIVSYVGVLNILELRQINKSNFFDRFCTYGIVVGRNLVSVLVSVLFAVFCTKVVTSNINGACMWHLVFFYIYLITMMTDVFLMRSHIHIISNVISRDDANCESLPRGVI